MVITNSLPDLIFYWAKKQNTVEHWKFHKLFKWQMVKSHYILLHFIMMVL